MKLLVLTPDNGLAGLLASHPVFGEPVEVLHYSTYKELQLLLKVADHKEVMAVLVEPTRIKDFTVELFVDQNPEIALVVLGEGNATAKGQVFYMVMPFELRGLVAMLKQILDTKPHKKQTLALGGYDFCIADRELRDGKASTMLTEKETALLVCLYEAAGGAVDRQELLMRVWGYNEKVDSRTVETHMYRLRKKLKKKQSLLQTVDGGYALDDSIFADDKSL